MVAARELDAHLVSRQKPGEMGACTIGDMSEDLGPVLELNPVHAVGKRLHDDPLHDRGALGHER